MISENGYGKCRKQRINERKERRAKCEAVKRDCRKIRGVFEKERSGAEAVCCRVLRIARHETSHPCGFGPSADYVTAVTPCGRVCHIHAEDPYFSARKLEDRRNDSVEAETAILDDA